MYLLTPTIASRVFTMLYALLKPICAPKTVSNVHIFGSDPKKWMPALYEKVALEFLPVKYGGTNTVAENVNMKILPILSINSLCIPEF